MNAWFARSSGSKGAARCATTLRGSAWWGVLLLVAAGLTGEAAPAAAQEVAYIDSEQILQQLPQYATVQQRLDRLTEQWEREVAAQKARVDTLREEFRAREPLYPEDERQRRRQEIEAAQQRVQQLRQRYFGPEEGRLYQRQQELMQPIQERVLAVVEEIAQAEGYDYVLDKGGPALFMYANEEHDLTADVLEELGIDIDESGEQVPAAPEEGGDEP